MQNSYVQSQINEWRYAMTGTGSFQFECGEVSCVGNVLHRVQLLHEYSLNRRLPANLAKYWIFDVITDTLARKGSDLKTRWKH